MLVPPWWDRLGPGGHLLNPTARDNQTFRSARLLAGAMLLAGRLCAAPLRTSGESTYEVPKYHGDMGAPNAFVPIEERPHRRKVDHLMSHFGSQLSKRWFKEDLFSRLLRLCGMECNSPSSYTEAFFCRKAVLA